MDGSGRPSPEGAHAVSVLVAVTDHAAERFRQRVGSRTGALDVKGEIVSRVVAAYDAGRVSTDAPPGATAARGSLFIDDLVDRAVVFVCRPGDSAAEVIVITLWEKPDAVGGPRVPQRFTNALKRDDERRRDP
jgi:hypothetical protein